MTTTDAYKVFLGVFSTAILIGALILNSWMVFLLWMFGALIVACIMVARKYHDNREIVQGQERYTLYPGAKPVNFDAPQNSGEAPVSEGGPWQDWKHSQDNEIEDWECIIPTGPVTFGFRRLGGVNTAWIKVDGQWYEIDVENMRVKLVTR